MMTFKQFFTEQKADSALLDKIDRKLEQIYHKIFSYDKVPENYKAEHRIISSNHHLFKKSTFPEIPNMRWIVRNSYTQYISIIDRDVMNGTDVRFFYERISSYNRTPERIAFIKGLFDELKAFVRSEVTGKDSSISTEEAGQIPDL